MATTKETQAQADAEDAPEGEAATKVPAVLKWLSLKLVVIAAAAVVALGAVGGGAYYFVGSRSEAAPASNVKPPVYLDMPEVLVNLSSSGSDRTQYLKVKVVLELPNEAMKTQIEPFMPRLMDTFQTYLRELRATDLDGSAGLYRLKEELTRRVNAAIAPERINAVLFKEIVVQ
ncbi:MAG TPA: flagellar basal body-associated FliL family protein [Xanthobacteraceae bacterium]|nr:flagellar basal body-associated FliL family protein [Xanthobacteraceae bacterium]